MKQILSQTYTVPGIGQGGLAGPGALLTIFEAAAKSHATMNDVGMEVLRREYNAGWMILKTSLRLTEPVYIGEQLEVTTWSRGCTGAADYRDYRLCRDGRELGRATQVWVVAELSRRRLLPAGRIPALQAYQPPEEVFTENPPRLFPGADERAIGTASVKPSDIDTNEHMNNVRYVDAAVALLPDFVPQSYLLELNYLAEVREGQQLEFFAASQDGVTTLTARAGQQQSFLLRLQDIRQ